MQNVFTNLDWSVLTNILMSVIPALICITFHELSHGYVAYRLGDDTAKRMGRLTLNPLKHIDVMGLIMMAVFRFGWAKPVPVDMRRFKNPKRGMAITALAGPISNVVLTAVFLFLYGVTYRRLSGSEVGGFFLQLMYLTSYISLALAIFNVIPIPPLDGSKVLFSALDDSTYMKLMRYERYGMLLLLALIATGILGTPLGKITAAAYDRMFVIAEYAGKLVA